MTAPTPTARGTPAGIKIKDGYRCLVTIAGFTTISFWEKTVKMPGADGGDMIDQTTMHNNNLRTFAPRSLITMTAMSGKAAFDMRIYNDILSALNVETTITVTGPNGDTLCFFGALNKFDAGEFKEGEPPEADYTISPTNVDPTTGAEQDYVLTMATGT